MDQDTDIIRQLVEFAYMMVIDLMFLVALVVLMLPLGIWRQAAFAVMKRNFIGYFSNPTGYVFLCLFVLLTSFAAFWPHEFFTTNLANFDQLNQFLPYIMLIFIPAITMGIWSEERRQGTDELLLTLPAKDFDIVIGKYFAAVLVFTVSLLFSQLSNYGVLLAMTGGDLDTLLLFSTYLGYWFMGIAMIALGMVASFLTNNLTVGFIFGAALNAPLAFFSDADVIFSDSTWVQRLFDWSLLQRFEPFGRGLISISSIFYFLGIVAIGVYLSLILIGRRHWMGGRDGTSMFWHYLVRAALVVVIAVGVVMIVQYSPLNQTRMDISESKINTLAPATLDMLERLSTEEDGKQILVEAYVSNNIPAEYVKLKYDLLNLLREFDVLGGSRLKVNLYQGIGPFSNEAILAEKKYGIRPQTVRSESRGAVREEEVVLGVAFSCGLERIVLPFLPYGTPVEYELMRSIDTVSKSERKTIGVVVTDVLPFGGTIRVAENQTTPIRQLAILAELAKQYDVRRVDANSPIILFDEDENGTPTNRRYDALVVIQPSQTTPTELDNIIAAIQAGQPTAIFEDPLPNPQFFPHFNGTFLPRRMSRNGSETADIQKLYDALDISLRSEQRGNAQQSLRFPYMVWHDPSQNQYPRNQYFNRPEQLIIQQLLTRDPRFSLEHPATRGIDQLYLQTAGYFTKQPGTDLDFEVLVNSGTAGEVLTVDFLEAMQSRNRDQALARVLGKPDAGSLMMAAAISGDDADAPLPEDSSSVERSKSRTNVIYVADSDTLADFYVQVRNQPVQGGIEYRYRNVSFFLNIIDSLTGVDTYLDLRNRRIEHVTLEVVEQTYEEAMNRVIELEQELEIEFQNALNAAETEIKKITEQTESEIKRELRKKENGQRYDAAKLAAAQKLLTQQQQEQATKFQNRREELEAERREKKRVIELEAEQEIQETQRKFKLAAVVIPPIPPLLVGLIVFTRRRLREREGISKARRLK